MKRKLTRKSLYELALIMPVLSEEVQRRYVGGGDGSESNPYTIEEYDGMVNAGTWYGGYVEGWGYTFGDLEVTGSISGSQNGVSGSYDGEWEDWDNDSGPQGGSGYWGDSGNYWGDTGNYFDDGYNTGVGGGSSSGGGNNGLQSKWNQIKPQISSQLAAYGYNLSGYNILIFDKPFRAGKDFSNNVNLGESFFYMPQNDQTSVLIHELIHIDRDIAYDSSVKIVISIDDFKFSNTMSNDVFEYYKSINFGDSIDEVLTILQGYTEEDRTLSDPQKYLNEINAYEEEKRIFPNVSEQYRKEREAMIYYYQELYRMALKNK